MVMVVVDEELGKIPRLVLGGNADGYVFICVC